MGSSGACACKRTTEPSFHLASMGAITNVVGFDDAPFKHEHRGDVTVIGAVCSRTRLDGVLASRVRRDGANATARMVELVERSPFTGHIRAVLLQGIAVA